MTYIVMNSATSSPPRPLPHEVETAAIRPRNGRTVTTRTSFFWNRAVFSSRTRTPGTSGAGSVTTGLSSTVDIWLPFDVVTYDAVTYVPVTITSNPLRAGPPRPSWRAV